MKETVKPALLRAKTGTLSVFDFETQMPFGALVNVATDELGLPIFLFSRLARHTKSLLLKPQASLLISEQPLEGDPLTGYRATFVGELHETELDSARYLNQHPYAALYIGFSDFGFWTMRPEMIYVVAGFGRIQKYSAHEIFN